MSRVEFLSSLTSVWDGREGARESEPTLVVSNQTEGRCRSIALTWIEITRD